MSPTAHFAQDRPAKLGLRVTHARDADEHAQNLSHWDQRYDQLSPGLFEGSVTELWLPKTQIFVETANRQLRQACAAWPESIWFGVPAAADGMMSMGGKPLSAQAVCLRDGGAEFDLTTAPNFNLFGIVVDKNTFAEYLEITERQNLDRLLDRGDVLNLPTALKRTLCDTLADILVDAGEASAPATDHLQERIFGVLAQLLLAGVTTDPAHRAWRHRQQVVAKVRERLLDDPEYPPSIPELCAQLHMSRRALQNCFDEVAGMGPLAYMRSLRLNEVRRELRYGKDARSVSNTAYAWGFTHMSQFAKDYQRLFGELPSETRCRQPIGAD